MTCEITKGPGFTMIVCSGRTTKKCSEFGCYRKWEKLCDYPLANGKTCQRLLCKGHAVQLSGEPGKDFCRAHATMKQGES